MLTILIVGAGQIGSRHLQSLARLKMPAKVLVFDPSEASLQVARDRFEEFRPLGAGTTDVTYSTGTDYPARADIVILAMSAKHRLAALTDLANRVEVKYLLLEKVLFQKLEDYDAAETLITKGGFSNVWVNIPAPMFDFYKSVRARGPYNDGGQAIFEGSQWNLGCNAVHVLFTAEWIFQSEIVSIATAQLDRTMIPSRRAGYMEFTGTLRASLANGTQAQVTSYRTGSMPYTVSVSSPDYSAVFDVPASIVRERDTQNGWQWSERPSARPLQSDHTSVFVEDVMATGRSVLPLYKDAAPVHVKLITALLSYMEQIGAPTADGCPIT